MQYELVQDALTGLFNSVALAGTSMLILASISTSLTYSRRQLPNHVLHTAQIYKLMFASDWKFPIYVVGFLSSKISVTGSID